ncbi:hypothetical protein JCM11641_002288 [Rhodosporidiobolus odoratus]
MFARNEDRTRRPRPSRRTTEPIQSSGQGERLSSSASASSFVRLERRAGQQEGVIESSEADSASLSPWTGMGSPSSSDFEAISDSEVRSLTQPSSAFPPPPHQPSQTTTLAPGASNLARSLSQRREKESSQGFIVSPARERGRWGSTGAQRGEEEEEDLRRGIEGDDEDSSAFEDAEDARGRGRTRRRDPELKKSLLEDALRSSLATLLSLAPAQAGMSQTPSLSHASLASLFSSSPFQTASSSSSSSSAASFRAPGSRPTAFASALQEPLVDDEDEDDEEEEADFADARNFPAQTQTQSRHEDVFLASSSSDSDSDGATQLGVHRPGAIPITRSPYQSSRASSFSPLQPSRPLGASVSESPPSSYRRRGSGLGWRRGRGRGGSASPGPGPASLEERRRARAEAAAGPEEAYSDLLSAAEFFTSLSPRSTSRSLPGSFPSNFSSALTASLAPLAQSAPATAGWPQRPTQAGHDAEEEELSDPALASESAPTLEGLSSGTSATRSRSPSSNEGEKTKGPERGKGDEKEGSAGRGGQARRGGFIGWLRGLGGAVVELKMWQLVGICGVLVGVGLGASSLIRHLASSTPLLDLLKPSSSTSTYSGSLIRVPPRLASFGTSNTRGEGKEGMSALFL